MGKMKINNKNYSLTINDKTSMSHYNGGFFAFDNVNWNSYIFKKHVVNMYSDVIGCVLNLRFIRRFFFFFYGAGDDPYEFKEQRGLSG